MKTMIITNQVDDAVFFDQIGIDRIFIDLEKIGKNERQKNFDSVKSNHSISDILAIRKVLKRGELLVRINPINPQSKLEIKQVIEAGADLIMLPMFTNPEEVEFFFDCINGQTRSILLFETPQSLCRFHDIIKITGLNEVYFGLNDLHIAFKLDFMLEMLNFPGLEVITNTCLLNKIPFGIGGIATMNGGLLEGKYVLNEFVRLGSERVILSREFVKTLKISSENFSKEFENFKSELKTARGRTKKELELNLKTLKPKINEIALKIRTERMQHV